MLPSTPLVLSPDGIYAFYFNTKETMLLCQKTLKVLHRRSTPSAPCLFAQFSSSEEDETLLVLERTRVVRLALPRMEEIRSVPVDDAVYIPEVTRGTTHVQLNLQAGELKRVLYYDPKEKSLLHRKLGWKKEQPFRYKGLHHENPVFSASKNFLAFARPAVVTESGNKNEDNVVLVPQFDLKQAKNYKTISKKKAIHGLYVHPKEQMVAATDSLGRILLLRHGQNKGNIVVQVFAWHSQPVHCLRWSQEGTYLYSGGQERVLVKWNLKENKKETMAPRLTGPVNHIVANEHGIVANLGSATLHRFNLEVFSVCFTRLEIREDVEFGDQIFWHKPTASLASLSKEGKILFYDPKEGRCVTELDIKETNTVTGEDPSTEQKEAAVPRRLSVSKDGASLAVYDDNAIRIFEFLESNKKWRQRAVITQPHKGTEVKQMTLFRSNITRNFELVTSGGDGATRLWASEAGKWGLSGTISYKKSSPSGHALSDDRTVVACAHEDMLTLWDADRLTLKGTLSRGEGSYSSLDFCSGRKPHLLFAAKAATGVVQLWDVLTYNCLLNFSAPGAVLRTSTLGNVFLGTDQGAYRVSGDCRVTKVHDGKVESAMEDDVGRSIIVQSDNSIKYDYNEPIDPGWKSFTTSAAKFSGLSVDTRVKTGTMRRDEAASAKDFIARRPLSHKLSEVLEELL